MFVCLYVHFKSSLSYKTRSNTHFSLKLIDNLCQKFELNYNLRKSHRNFKSAQKITPYCMQMQTNFLTVNRIKIK